LPYFGWPRGRTELLEYSGAASVRQRLELFRAVARRAVCHQNLIVHRMQAGEYRIAPITGPPGGRRGVSILLNGIAACYEKIGRCKAIRILNLATAKISLESDGKR